jgi:hypothetical protein
MPRKPPRTQRKAPVKRVKKQPQQRKQQASKNQPRQRKQKQTTVIFRDRDHGRQIPTQQKVVNLKRKVVGKKNSGAFLLDLSQEDVHDLDSMLLQLIRGLFTSGVIPTVRGIAKALNVDEDVATDLVGLHDNAEGKRKLAQRLQNSKPLRIFVTRPGDDAHRIVHGSRSQDNSSSNKEEFQCHVCHVTIISAKSWKSHLSGWRHKHAVAADESILRSRMDKQRSAPPPADDIVFFEDTAGSFQSTQSSQRFSSPQHPQWEHQTQEQLPNVQDSSEDLRSHHRAPTPFIKFCDANREGMKHSNPSCGPVEIFKAYLHGGSN